jgi:hypothetical protein
MRPRRSKTRHGSSTTHRQAKLHPGSGQGDWFTRRGDADAAFRGCGNGETVVATTRGACRRDAREDARDAREDARDAREDARDAREDARDAREDARDAREDARDARGCPRCGACRQMSGSFERERRRGGGWLRFHSVGICSRLRNMKDWTWARLGVVVSFSCVACGGTLQDAKFAGGVGDSCATAVQIQGVDDERSGVRAEHAWLAQHYPGHTVNSQALIDCNGKKADQLAITTADGVKKDVFFDISAFFGKY